MNEARFFTTDGREITRLEDTTLVPECLKDDIREAAFTRLGESFEATFEVDTRGSDLLRFRIAMGVIPDIRRIPRVRIRKPGWEGMR